MYFQCQIYSKAKSVQENVRISSPLNRQLLVQVFDRGFCPKIPYPLILRQWDPLLTSNNENTTQRQGGEERKIKTPLFPTLKR
jgi:hypothetical protein